MSFRTILVPIEQHDLMNSTLETALCLAQKFDCYIEGFALRVASPAAYAMADAAAVAVTIPTLERDIAEKCQANARPLRELHAKVMVCRVGLLHRRYQASGWKMPLKGTALWVAMAGSSI
jgi:hypothetical protein